MNVWLDDVRPAPPGWLHVKTVAGCRAALEKGDVKRLSLDHDLGWCESCAEDTAVRGYAAIVGSCHHIGTGYDLCTWMEETGIWPAMRPTVHSANPVGRQRMEQVIAREAARGRWR